MGRNGPWLLVVVHLALGANLAKYRDCPPPPVGGRPIYICIYIIINYIYIKYYIYIIIYMYVYIYTIFIYYIYIYNIYIYYIIL